MGLPQAGGGSAERVFIELSARTAAFTQQINAATLQARTALGTLREPVEAFDASLGGVGSTRVDQVRARFAGLRETVGGLSADLEATSAEAGTAGSALSGLGIAGGLALTGVVVILGAIINKLIQVAKEASRAALQFVVGGVEMNASLEIVQLTLSNMIGSEEAALNLITEMRQEAARLGFEATSMTNLGRALIPYSQGDEERFSRMITLAEQLALLDPAAGLTGAARALRDIFSGEMQSLWRTFELPRAALQELQAEFRSTGDIDVLISSLSDLVGQFGITE